MSSSATPLTPKWDAISGCKVVSVSPNRDARGCLYEIFRESWAGAFHAVQWNACASSAGVLRGFHVHVDYTEFYTLPRGSVLMALKDIRRKSPSFGSGALLEWSDSDDLAVVIPEGVAHAVYFVEESTLVFGLSAYWKAELDVVGCRWDDPHVGVAWPEHIEPVQSERDCGSGTYAEMIEQYERLSTPQQGVVAEL